MPGEPAAVVVLGASSQMAMALLHTYAQASEPRRHWILVVRSGGSVASLASVLRQHHQVLVVEYDMMHNGEIPPLPPVQEVWSFTGWLPATNHAAAQSMQINYHGVRKWIDHVVATQAATLQFILVVGSIAGVRIRPSNAAYGAAKQQLHKYAAELRKRLAPGVQVSLVIPGYVRTRMLPHATPHWATLSPAQMAQVLRRVVQQRPATAYSQPFWKWVAMLLPHLPAWVVAKMR